MQYQKASEKIDQVLQNGYISEIMFDNDFWRTVKSAVDDKIAADETVKQKRKALTRAYAELGEMLIRTQMTNSDEFNEAICVALQCIENELNKMVGEGKMSENISSNVSHPSHYTYGNIECIDFILDKDLDFPLGNAVKYIVRAGHKKSADKSDLEKQIEDLQKAQQYITFEIEHLKGER